MRQRKSEIDCLVKRRHFCGSQKGIVLGEFVKVYPTFGDVYTDVG